MNGSPEYFAAIAEGARHHARSKTYSGSFLRPQKPFLIDLVDRLAISSAIDVGCGKGDQYRWVDPGDGKTIEEAVGFEIFKYDPCWPPYALEPSAGYVFDLAICTHTISLIPLQDLHWFTERLFRWGEKAVFVAEKIGSRKKGEIADPENRAINWNSAQWLDWFKNNVPVGWTGELTLSLLERTDRGKVTTRWVYDHSAQEFVGTVLP